MSGKKTPIHRAAGLNSQWAKGLTLYLAEKRRRKEERKQKRKNMDVKYVKDGIGRAADGKFVSVKGKKKVADKSADDSFCEL